MIEIAGNRLGAGFFPAGHLQVVRGDEELEVQSGAYWVVLERQHSDNENTPYFGDPANYTSIDINIEDGRNEDDVWDILVQVTEQLRLYSGQIQYGGLQQNSNSFVNTILSVIGVDLVEYMPSLLISGPFGSGIPSYPGDGDNVLYGGVGAFVSEGDSVTWQEDLLPPVSLSLVGTGGIDLIVVGDGNDSISGAGGNDTLRLGLGCDDASGGQGNDTLEGGSGADLLHDRGADTPQDIEGGETGAEYLERLFAYDSSGNDRLYGGDGADILVYSGGSDEFYGGAGDDSYIVVADAQTGLSANDFLSIRLAGEFGHDTIAGYGSGIGEVVFDGVNSEGITVNFEFTEQLLDEQSAELDALFPGLTGIEGFDLGTYPVYKLNGSLEIIVNATGSSVFIEDVVGAYVGGANAPGGNIHVLPVISSTFDLVFDDLTFTNWANIVEQVSGASFVSSSISDTADDAASSFEDERDECADNQFPVSNSVNGDENDNVLEGTEEAERIQSFGGDDEIDGKGGDDWLDGGSGADIINGGDGFDVVDYSSSTAAVTVNLASGSASGGYAEGDTLISIEDVLGSYFDDTLKGDNSFTRTFLDGREGDDLVESGWGAQDSYLYGGTGDDALIVRSGNSYLAGGEGNDDLFGNSGVDQMYGGSDDDELTASFGDDYYDGGEGFDILTSEFIFAALDTYEINLAEGYAVDLSVNTSTPGIGTNTLVSIEGYIGGRAVDLVTGSDVANYIDSGRGDDQILGMGGDDTLFGGFQNDLLDGGEGDDVLDGGRGHDTLRGGEGNDIVVYEDEFSTYGFSTLNGILFVTDSNGDTDQIEDDVEIITFSDSNYTWSELSGITQNQVPVANPDAFTITEGQTLTFDPRLNDTDGNADPLTVATINGIGISTTNTITLGNGLVVQMSPDGVLEISAEADINGLNAGETLNIELTYEVTDGVGGFDSEIITVTVNAANGSSGNGTITGTSGNDVIDGTFTDDPEGDVVTNNGDTIDAGAGDDKIYDGDGDDVVFGGDGRDTFFGGAGEDQYDGGDHNGDSLTYSFASEGVTVDLVDGSNNTGIAAGDTYTNIEAITGSSHDDIIVGDGLILNLNGGAGNDLISGRLSAGSGHTMTGGTGADSFEFTHADILATNSVVTDFEAGVDSLTVDGVVLSDLQASQVPDGFQYDHAADGDLVISFKGTADDYIHTIELDGLTAEEFFADGPPPPPASETFTGTSGNDVIGVGYTNADGEVITDEYKQFVVYGGEGDDNIKLTRSTDSEFYGGAGNDTIDGKFAFDAVFYGGDGDDQLFLGMRETEGFGGAGDDLISGRLSKGTGHTMTSGTGADSFEFTYVADKATNSVVTDFEAGVDSLTVDGVVLSDLQASQVPDGFQYDHAADGDLVISFKGTADDYIHTIELDGLTAEEFFADGPPPPPASETFTGTSGNDVIGVGYTNADGEVITDEYKQFVVYGGEGDDNIKLTRSTDSEFYGGAGNDTIDGKFAFDAVFYGGDGDDQLFLGMRETEGFGGAGDDLISGRLSKGTGHTMTGGTGADSFEFTYVADKATNSVVTDFEAGVDSLTVDGVVLSDLQASQVPDGFQYDHAADGDLVISFKGTADDYIHTIELDGLTAEEFFADGPPPPPASETFTGTSGNDVIGVGYTNADGEVITDEYKQFVVYGGEGDDNIKLTRSTDSEFYGGAGNDTIDGKFAFDAVFYGGDGDDQLFLGMRETEGFGGAGDDLISGRLSKGTGHTMTGGTGADSFEFTYVADKATNSVVTDFEAGVDSLTVDGVVLSDLQASQVPDGFQYDHAADGDLVISFKGTADDYIHTIELDGLTAEEFFWA